MNEREFKELIWQKSRELYREMPWRQDTRPYYVLVSEVMLQQTQVRRVIPKFDAFIGAFPNETALAQASLAEVLQHWQGLGYNRRAKYLQEATKKVVSDFGGKFPDTLRDLLQLPGVGKNTAGAILAYSFNQPTIFVETNIRTVYIHHFFNDNFGVTDKQIVELLEATIDQERPREFYWALMDYGSWLKANGIKNIAQSKHYKKQTLLRGSLREMRGWIMRELAGGDKTEADLVQLVRDERFEPALAGLIKDGLVTRKKQKIHLTK